MTPLTFVEPTEVEPTMNILLYGPPGTGKTMGAATAPGPILWLNAEGPGAIRLARETHGDKIREVALEGMSDFDEAYLYLLSDEGKEIKTLVVDTLGEAYQIFFNEIEGPRKDHLKNHGAVKGAVSPHGWPTSMPSSHTTTRYSSSVTVRMIEPCRPTASA